MGPGISVVGAGGVYAGGGAFEGVVNADMPGRSVVYVSMVINLELRSLYEPGRRVGSDGEEYL